MDKARELLRRVHMLLHRRQFQEEMDEEMRLHLELSKQEQVDNGLRAEVARRAAYRKFGNPTVIREKSYMAWGWGWLESLVQDARYAMRQLWKTPGFTATAILTLALGIGANAAIFQLVDAVRLRSLPIRAPQELAELRIVGGNGGFGDNDGTYSQFTLPMWQEVRRNHEPFSGVFAWQPTDIRVGKPSESKNIYGLAVTGEFFNVLGVAPWQGRLIEPQDGEGCEASRAVVSYPYWKSEMGGQPITSNTSLILNGKLVQVLGVTPPSFFGLSVGDRFDVAIPMCIPPNPRREEFIVNVMGRLNLGWTLDRASAYFGALSKGIFEDTAPTDYSADAIKAYKSFRLAAYPAGSGVSELRDRYDTSLKLLLTITGLVLLIACANLANLMLARSGTRQREMAIRIALGASRARLLRQLLIESGLLAFTGAACGVALSQPLGRLLVASLNTSQSSIQLAITTDWRVLLFAAAVAILTAIIFGTIPALRGTKADPITSLKSGTRGMTSSRERFSVQRLMVITQIAVSMVLLVGALLFVRSYRNLVTLDPGMRENGITIAEMGFPESKITPENEAAFKRQLIEDVRNVPGIQNAASTSPITPLSGGGWSHGIHIGDKEGYSQFTYVSPTYFATMGIPLLTGRNFTDNDTNSSPYVLIVNQAFIRRYLGNAPPIGQPVHVMPEPQYPERTYQIVGTIADTKYKNLREDTPPMAFVPAAQMPATADGSWAVLMIASNNKAAAIAGIQHVIEAKYPSAVLQFVDFKQNILDNLVGDRMMAMLSGFFGFLATLLVVVGLYGVLSFLITQRRNEIGIRIALGARRRQVIGLVMRDAATMLLVGVVFGTTLALLAGRSASAMFFGLKPYDAATLTFAFFLLAAIAVLASWLPALKASGLDPVAALRSE